MAAARKPKPVPQEERQTYEFPISADGVMKLAIGSRVNLHGEDADGNRRLIECTIAGSSRQKFMTYRHGGQLRKCAIKEYPNKYYTKVV